MSMAEAGDPTVTLDEMEIRKMTLTRKMILLCTHLLLPVLAACLLVAIWPSSSRAATAGAAHWEAQLIAKPTNFKVGSAAETNNVYEVALTNIGGAPSGGPIGVTLRLAPGVSATEIKSPYGNFWEANCSILAGGAEVSCLVPGLEPNVAVFRVLVDVSAAAQPFLTSTLAVSEGVPSTTTFERGFTNPVDPATAPFAITNFSNYPTGPAGEPFTTAAGHPTLLNTLITSPVESIVGPGVLTYAPVKNDKDIVIDLPAGFVGNPLAAPKCPIQVFLAQQRLTDNCPPGSQIGAFTISGGGGLEPGEEGLEAVGTRNPIFNLTPEPGYPAELGFYDKGLSHGVLAPATLAHTSQGYVVRVIAPELVTGVFGPFFLQTSFFGNPQKAAGLRGEGAAFLTAPAACSGQPLRTEAHFDLWADPAPVPVRAGGTRDFAATDFSDPRWIPATAEAPAVIGCEGLHFNPRLDLRPDETAADSPSGLGVDLQIPQNEDPEGTATPPLRDATVPLPPGLVVNPSSADGLAGCSEAQLGPNSTEPGGCPAASKIGTVSVRTPLVDHALPGSVYLGTPDCQPCGNADAVAGRLLKLYIEIDDPVTGVVVKLPGSVSASPGSGQLTASFKNNPQLPFEDLELHFKSGPRATLTTPPTCGEYTTATDLMPWSAPQSGPDAAPQSRFKVTSGPGGSACASSEARLGNAPAFEAGTTVPLAGTYSPFVLKVSRENGTQRIGAIDTTLPPGLAGKLAGIPYCSDAAIAAAGTKSGTAERANPSCPSASEIGIVNVGAGSGTPFYVQGHAYLAGPYKGAPLSLEIITPAVAGPFDLGTVAVRTALYVDPFTAQIHAVSDPIPSILAGIPLDVRSIALNLSRPQFTLNPTSCDPMNVVGSTTSTLGQSASLQSRFQVGGCNGLGFKPSVKLSLKGATRRIGHPALKAVVTYPKKGTYANIARAMVNLPHSEFLDQGNLNKTCTRPVLIEGKCPKTSIYGKAKAWSPLLEKPLQGPVYLVGGFGYKLPALVAELSGQVRVLLVGKVDSGPNKGIRNTFEAVPDAPVSRFVLEMKGGPKYGLLENSENLCKKPQQLLARFTAQNGAVEQIKPKIANDCKGNKSGGKRGK